MPSQQESKAPPSPSSESADALAQLVSGVSMAVGGVFVSFGGGGGGAGGSQKHRQDQQSPLKGGAPLKGGVSRLKGADGGTPPGARRRDGHGLAAEDEQAQLLNALAQHEEEQLLLEKELLDALAPLKVKGLSISSSLLRY